MTDAGYAIMGNPDPDDPRLDQWVNEVVTCTRCGRDIRVVMTLFHWETKTGELHQSPILCNACLVLNELSPN